MSKEMKAEPAEAKNRTEKEERAAALAPEPSEIEEEISDQKASDKEGSTEKAPKEPKGVPKKKAGAKKEGAKEQGKKDEEEGEKVVEEKTLTVNLRHAYLAYSRKPAPRSVKLVRKVASKVFKTEDVKIDNSLNSILWSRGKTKAERRVAIKVQKLEDGTVRVLPATEA